MLDYLKRVGPTFSKVAGISFFVIGTRFLVSLATGNFVAGTMAEYARRFVLVIGICIFLGFFTAFIEDCINGGNLGGKR